MLVGKVGVEKILVGFEAHVSWQTIYVTDFFNYKVKKVIILLLNVISVILGFQRSKVMKLPFQT
jgi:hypothetical protein